MPFADSPFNNEVTLNDPPNGYSLGNVFTVSQTVEITAMRLYQTSGNLGTVQIGIYVDSTMTRIAYGTLTPGVTTGWVEITFDSPVTLSAGVDYMWAFIPLNSSSARIRYYSGISGLTDVPFDDGITTFTFKEKSNNKSWWDNTRGQSLVYPDDAFTDSYYITTSFVTKYNQPPNQPIARYEGNVLSTLQGSPTEMTTKEPIINVQATDPDPGDTLEYKIDIRLTNDSIVWSGTYQVSNDINVPASANLQSNTVYKVEAFAKDQDGAETQSVDYFIFIQSLYEIQLSEIVTVLNGDTIYPVGYSVDINGLTATLVNIDFSTKEYTFEVSGVNSDSIIIKVTGKNGDILDNLLYAIS